MTQEEQLSFAETVHAASTNGENPMQKLVYRNGEFVYMPTDEQPEEGEVVTVFTEEGFAADGSAFIPSREEIYSRFRGIFEVDTLKDKRVLIIGLGSFGSRIAVALVQEGVGSFCLIDFDMVELHNLSRHIATVHDIGRLKTDVVEEAILGKNPYATVDKCAIDINSNLQLLLEEVQRADIVICATDNNQSRFNIAKALAATGSIGIFGRAFTRAEGGDVLRYHPGGPCYCCLMGKGDGFEEEITNVASARRDGRIAAYVSENDADAMVSVGLSSDIEPICNMMVKLALIELSRNEASGLAALGAELEYDYYLWANRRERHFENWLTFNSGGQPSIMRWYGARIHKNELCPVCGNSIALGDGPDDMVKGLENVNIDLD